MTTIEEAYAEGRKDEREEWEAKRDPVYQHAKAVSDELARLRDTDPQALYVQACVMASRLATRHIRDAVIPLAAQSLREVEAWRQRFPQYRFSHQDDCIELKAQVNTK